MTDLMEFLRARLDDDEQVARAALPGPWLPGTAKPHLVDWVVYGQSRSWAGHLGQVCDVEVAHDGAFNAEHIARHDPTRVLAEVAAKRAVLALHWIAVDQTNAVDGLATCNECVEYAPCDTLRILASVYAGHPGYDWSWAVTS